ncbi:MAG TPA: hypothetical protein ENN65_00875 [Candidatus Hydrogenedentes bacterium]|nr:hypothetical protein [Candidatus Hydrogenedentota bacterium]
MDYVEIGGLRVSRFIIGGNPFSGFSHQTVEKNREMVRYFTTARIKETLRDAERLGVNTHVGRADHHIMRVLLEYWDEGGSIQWFAQTCPEVGDMRRGIQNAVDGGAKACYLHGGMMDFLYANDALDEVPDAIARIRDAGMPAGIAAHEPGVIAWARDHLDLDFFMCCHYNIERRDRHAEHRPGSPERYAAEDRDRMTALIRTLDKPAIHYKVLAAGRNRPEDAFAYLARHMRPNDAVCVGIFPKDNPNMLQEDIALLEKSLRNAAALGSGVRPEIAAW